MQAVNLPRILQRTYEVAVILELPVTTTELYAAFHILHDDCIDLWEPKG